MEWNKIETILLPAEPAFQPGDDEKKNNVTETCGFCLLIFPSVGCFSAPDLLVRVVDLFVRHNFI